MGLLYGRGDYGKKHSFKCNWGWDTDCNGATTGLIIGVMLGARNLPTEWIKPLNDRVRRFLIGYDNSRISDLAKRL